MTSAFVADSSVGVSWAVPSQSSKATGELLEEVASGRPFLAPGRISALAEEHSLSVYDAAYLEPAQRRGLTTVLRATAFWVK